MTADDITRAVNALLSKYGADTKVIPASSLWLELGFRSTTWRAVDRATQAVAGGTPLGTDYSPAWIKEHAAALATEINKEAP